MTHPEEQGIEMERRAAEFEKLLEQLDRVDRLSTAQEKTHPENDAEEKTPKA
jgi:hypothetical protein